LLAAIWSRAGS